MLEKRTGSQVKRLAFSLLIQSHRYSQRCRFFGAVQLLAGTQLFNVDAILVPQHPTQQRRRISVLTAIPKSFTKASRANKAGKVS